MFPIKNPIDWVCVCVCVHCWFNIKCHVVWLHRVVRMLDRNRETISLSIALLQYAIHEITDTTESCT